jgi:hypothetical protein
MWTRPTTAPRPLPPTWSFLCHRTSCSVLHNSLLSLSESLSSSHWRRCHGRFSADSGLRMSQWVRDPRRSARMCLVDQGVSRGLYGPGVRVHAWALQVHCTSGSGEPDCQLQPRQALRLHGILRRIHGLLHGFRLRDKRGARVLELGRLQLCCTLQWPPSQARR